jgi:RHS repeat-associated protein
MCIGIYPGQYWDAETGLQYNWHRYYDPNTGRYLREDPIWLVGGINPYVYVENNPMNLVDPFGLERYPQADSPHVVGRPGTIVPPGGKISSFIENNVGSGYTFGQAHDALVDYLTSHYVPDPIANIPTMVPAYLWAITKDMSTLSDDQKPNYFPIIEIRFGTCE